MARRGATWLGFSMRASSRLASAFVAVLLEFEWDPRKAAANLRKHGVGFEEAATAFGDPLSITIPDPDHSTSEDRYILVGRAERGRLLVVAHLDRGMRIRLISARTATRHERRSHEEEAS